MTLSMPLPKCNQCLKSPEICVCDQIQHLQSKIHVLILQHPQEPDKDLGTARLAHLALPNSTLKIGLSWPNLKKALGKEAQPARWAVLYLGSGVQGIEVESSQNKNQDKNQNKKSSQTTRASKQGSRPIPLQFVSKKGAPVEAPAELDGIVVLDGSWSQAKTLWWRNAWLLKLQRAILSPSYRSIYKELRKEPRPECLSTLETIADTLTLLGENVETEKHLKGLFQALIQKHRLIRGSKGNKKTDLKTDLKSEAKPASADSKLKPAN